MLAPLFCGAVPAAAVLRADPGRGHHRRPSRRIFWMLGLSLMPIPPGLIWLAMSIHDHAVHCGPQGWRDALALLCVAAAGCLAALLVAFRRSTVGRLTSMPDVRAISLFVLIGIASYLAWAAILHGGFCTSPGSPR